MTSASSHDSALRESPAEEIPNSVTHGIGWLLSIVGLVVGTVWAVRRGDPWVITSIAIYGTTLVLLFGASTLYHAIGSARMKRVLQKCDHVAIFLLIAGTYTPFMLVNLRGPWGWSIFGVVWGIALLGAGFKFAFAGRFLLLSSALYVVMGWLILIAAKPLTTHVPPSGLVLLVVGGLCYTGGVIFYLWHRLPFNHAIWHLFVLAGSACHYVAVFKSVA